MIERLDFFRSLAAMREDQVVITTMTATLQWPLVSEHPLDFDFLAFGMGHAADFGMGVALAQPDRTVIVLMGDGGILMSLGSLVTIGRYAPPNLVVFLLENRVYEMTGGQEFSAGADFVALARGAGIADVERFDDLERLEGELGRLLDASQPRFVVLGVTNNEPLPPVAHSDHSERVVNLRKGLGVG